MLEVGLGGRLDATNVVTPELCVITPIDFDHEAFLGRSLEAIAGEKAGILKAGVPAVFARQRREAAAVLDLRAAELCIPVARTEAWTHRRSGAGRARQPLSAQRRAAICASSARWPASTRWRMPRPPPWRSTRLGVSEPRNRARASRRRRWPGRLERVSEHPEIILDGAHNPAGARALAAYIERFYAGRRVRLIYGAMRDKAIDEIGGILFPLAAAGDRHRAAPGARAVARRPYAQVAEHHDLRTAPTLREALAMVQDATAEDVIFITGSLFLVAEAREMLVL